MLNLTRKKRQQEEDLGFGTQINQASRFLNQDGSFNVKRTGLPFFKSLNSYHLLITMSWTQFNLVVLTLYIVVNLFFASLYVLAGTHHLDGVTGTSMIGNFIDAFFFSTQTFTTVGYGHVSPVGVVPNIIAAIESLAGLLSLALATGLLYGRFARPLAKIIYSEKALIAPYRDGITSFEFKIANSRKHELIEVEVEVYFACKATQNGKLSRRFDSLNLERTKISLMPLTWTIVHPIDENSPLYGVTASELEESDAEFLIILKAFDDTFSQQVYSRSSYKYHEIIWGAKFTNNFSKVENGVTIVELDKTHDYVEAKLPELISEREISQI